MFWCNVGTQLFFHALLNLHPPGRGIQAKLELHSASYRQVRCLDIPYRTLVALALENNFLAELYKKWFGSASMEL